MITPMDYDSLSKRRLYSTLGWVLIGLVVIFNIAVTVADIPLQALLIVVPIVNIVLIIAWLFVRTLFNISNSKLKHDQKMSLRPEDTPPPQYGQDAQNGYIPNLTVDSELFKSITTEPGKSVFLDSSMKDYLEPGRVMVFHDEVDYGSRKEVRVSKVITGKQTVETFFTRAS